MRNKSPYIFFLLVAIACNLQAQQQVAVEHYGVLKEIMREQKIDANVDLSRFKETPNFYAIGALAGLAGEVLIIDGKVINGIATKGDLRIERDFDKSATLLVTSEVQEWVEISININVQNLESIQTIIEEEAKRLGLKTNEAFPFMLKGKVKNIDWHVINASEATEQRHEAFKKAGISRSTENVNGEILGFYSEQHEGIFTHHGSFLHVHYVNSAETEMGHVDNLVINGEVKLLLPKMKKS